MGSSNRPSLWLAAPVAAPYAAFVLWPLGNVLWLALHHWNGYGPSRWAGLTNFPTLLADGGFRQSLLHSVEWEAAAAVIPLVAALGFVLLAGVSRIAPALFATVFAGALLPPTAVASIWTLLLSPLRGPVNSVLRAAGLGMVASDWLGDPHLALASLFVAWLWSSLGVSMLLIWMGMQGIGLEYVEIARIEGAGALWRLIHITIPALRRTLVVGVVVNVALGAQVFDLVFTTTGGGPGYATVILPLDIYNRAFGGRTGEGAASACFSLAAGLVLVALAALLLRPNAENFAGNHPFTRANPRPRTVLGAALSVAWAFPLLWIVWTALQPDNAGISPTSGFTVDNLGAVWSAGMSDALAQSASTALAVTVVVVLLGAPAAFALAYGVRNRVAQAAAGALLVAGLLQPTTVLIIPLFAELRSLDLLNSQAGIVLVEAARTVPFAVLVLWAWMGSLEREILDAARVDGAPPLRQLLQIVLPLSLPAVVAVAAWSWIGSWNEYLLPAVLSQDGSVRTVPTLVASFIGTYNTQAGPLAAGALLAMLPTLILYLLVSRRLAHALRPVR